MDSVTQGLAHAKKPPVNIRNMEDEAVKDDQIQNLVGGRRGGGAEDSMARLDKQ